jgi:hypothetical protein
MGFLSAGDCQSAISWSDSDMLITRK